MKKMQEWRPKEGVVVVVVVVVVGGWWWGGGVEGRQAMRECRTGGRDTVRGGVAKTRIWRQMRALLRKSNTRCRCYTPRQVTSCTLAGTAATHLGWPVGVGRRAPRPRHLRAARRLATTPRSPPRPAPRIQPGPRPVPRRDPGPALPRTLQAGQPGGPACPALGHQLPQAGPPHAPSSPRYPGSILVPDTRTPLLLLTYRAAHSHPGTHTPILQSPISPMPASPASPARPAPSPLSLPRPAPLSLPRPARVTRRRTGRMRRLTTPRIPQSPGRRPHTHLSKPRKCRPSLPPHSPSSLSAYTPPRASPSDSRRHLPPAQPPAIATQLQATAAEATSVTCWLHSDLSSTAVIVVAAPPAPPPAAAESAACRVASL